MSLICPGKSQIADLKSQISDRLPQAGLDCVSLGPDGESNALECDGPASLWYCVALESVGGIYAESGRELQPSPGSPRGQPAWGGSVGVFDNPGSRPAYNKRGSLRSNAEGVG